MTEELPQDEMTERQKLIVNLNKANNDILQRITRMSRGQFEIDPTGARMEMFLEKLIEFGVITSDQMEEFNLAWVDHFNSYLMQKETQLREALVKAQERSTGLATPGAAGGLIVPGNGGRPGGVGRRGRG